MRFETYYKDHWIHIEDERLERYEKMFKWNSSHEQFLEPADIQPGHTIGDIGCGPGFMSLELLKKVGLDGHVHAFDVNKAFIQRTRIKADTAGLGEQLSLYHLTTTELPIQSETLDRILAKNVMAYVDNPTATFREFYRAIKPGGKVHVIDSDFSLVTIDPVPPEKWRALMDAAVHAFRTPNIGRQLYRLARAAGFSQVDVRIVVTPDLDGRLLNLAQNMADYAREAGSIDETTICEVLEIAKTAVTDKTYFAINPQFMVTATI